MPCSLNRGIGGDPINSALPRTALFRDHIRSLND